ncbi:MAG: sugar ABC transporter permease [Lachnospiraceae bacterium]|nr:sugar ABC transporter permease [Lachnospiraceae bacterium]
MQKNTLNSKRNLIGWVFIIPAFLLIVMMYFYPMIKALILSFYSGVGANFKFVGISNYIHMFKDKVFMQALKNTFLYLIVQVPIMLMVALILATLLNDKTLKLKGLYRTAIFLPCATSLVSYAIIFRSIFAVDGIINLVLIKVGILETGYNFLAHPISARIVIIIALLWRWTGYNMVFFLAGLQGIDPAVYEAAKIDGASSIQSFFKVTVPLLKPTLILTAIISINGTLQLFDESVNLTYGGPANSTITMTHYIYDVSFKYVPNFGYAAAMAYLILVIVAILSFIQLKVGDKRE